MMTNESDLMRSLDAYATRSHGCDRASDSARAPIISVAGRTLDAVKLHLSTMDRYLSAAVDSATSGHDIVISW